MDGEDPDCSAVILAKHTKLTEGEPGDEIYTKLRLTNAWNST